MNSVNPSDEFYTVEQVSEIIRYSRYSGASGKNVYEAKNVLNAFRRAIRSANDADLEREYKLGVLDDKFSRAFLEKLLPFIPGAFNCDGKPLKVLEFPAHPTEPEPAPANTTVPPIDPAYTAKVVQASAQRELERANGQSPFDQIRHVDQQGEWWDARELQGVLGYQASWQNFENAIEKAKLSLKTSDGLEADHFNDIIKMIGVGKGGQRSVNSYRLSRHACHLIAQNGDPSKPEIAAAQRYFSVQTRRAELMDAGLSPMERTAHIDALVSGQQQLTAAVDELGENLGGVEAKVLTAIEVMQQQLEALKLEIQEKTPENKRRQFPLSVQKRVGRLFYEYTRGGGCLGNRHIQVIDANGDKISPMQFDHWDGNESRNVYDNCVPMSLELHKRKTAGKLTAEERKRIEGFIDWMRMIEDDTEESQLQFNL